MWKCHVVVQCTTAPGSSGMSQPGNQSLEDGEGGESSRGREAPRAERLSGDEEMRWARSRASVALVALCDPCESVLADSLPPGRVSAEELSGRLG